MTDNPKLDTIVLPVSHEIESAKIEAIRIFGNDDPDTIIHVLACRLAAALRGVSAGHLRLLPDKMRPLKPIKPAIDIEDNGL